MSITPYRSVLANQAARRALVLGILLRIPIFGTGVLLMLHVVEHLDRSWAEAGLVSAVATLAIAVSGPWRGRLLDRHGLRKVVAPSIVITGSCWAVAPFVGYWPLLFLAGLAGLFVVPIFSIARQSVIAAVPLNERRTALSVDGVGVELAYMSGPAVAVWAGHQFGTAITLFALQMLGVVGGIVLWLLDPSLREEGSATADAAAQIPRSEWFRPAFVGLCLAAAASTLVLVGSEVAVVAGLRQWGESGSLGLVFAGWGVGSILGGLYYGAMSRGLSPYFLLAGLALVTAPMALADSALTVAGLAVLAGVFCAPTITASVEAVSRVVPAAARGEAMGWHGSCMTAGSALAAPLVGMVIDGHGHQSAIVLVCVLGLVVALAGAAAAALVRSRRSQLIPAH
ncbi:MFS transporter [Calidifontibacter indicus]|uniref:Putative MFS family arabinose efflux permease n=1 Tax=Calidifontibacter indicus TaxID=419650 RepID=A0A3D9UNJ4_9MICO|nr:MFS transporter [Calidifontibacter indicus]REF30909.1 putative MFS family arabinose efflux permease [Calidifontibacter indicus]